MKRIVVAVSFLFLAAVLAADVATIPTNLSPRGVADWAIIGGNVGSGTGALPAAGAEGSRYSDISTPTAIIEYRSTGGAWRPVTSSSGGVATHSALTNLGFADAGHLGFASEAAVDSVSASLATVTGDLSSHVASYDLLVASHDVTLVILNDDIATLTGHMADQTDPHGASTTFTAGLVVGSGTADASIARVSTGTVGIASYIWIPPTTATPTNPASFTLWGDANTGKVRCYDGSAWQDLW